MEYIAWILVASVAAVIVYYFLKFMRIVASVAHIPGPYVLPFIGNALMFVGKTPNDLLQILTDEVMKYGLVHRLFLGPKILIHFVDPEDVEAILTSPTTIDKSEEYEFAKVWIGEGLVTSTGEKWFSRRKVTTPAFHFNILQSFVKVFDGNSEIFVDKLSKFEALDIYPLTLLCALDNICEAAMGTKINAQNNADSSYVKAVEEITSIISKRQYLLHLRSDFIFSFTKYYKRQRVLLKVLHGFTDNVILARRDKLVNEQAGVQTDSKQKLALIDILLKSTIDGKPLSNLDIREEVDTFMFAGHDTTTSGISFCLYNIAKYPEVQQNSFDEIRNVMGDDALKEISFDDLQRLNYLDRVIKESLRLFPPVPVIGRKINEQVVINGKVIPKGSNIGISPLFMGRNSTIWKDPMSFMPERFELDRLAHQNPFSFIPFSAGKRNCIGQRFAMLEMKSVISKVLRRFELAVEPGFEVELNPELVLKPLNGIKLRLKARSYEVSV